MTLGLILAVFVAAGVSVATSALLRARRAPVVVAARLVRLQVEGVKPVGGDDGTVTVEGYMTGAQPVRNPGSAWGHYLLDRPKIVRAEDETHSLGSTFEVPERRVIFVEVLAVDASGDA